MKSIDRNLIIGIALAVLLFSFNGVLSASAFSGGSGTEEDPYLIEDGTDLELINYYSSAYFLQVADIDLINYDPFYDPWIPIQGFTGHYDGNNYLITELNIGLVNGMSSGLFSTNAGTIKRVKIEGSISAAENYIGLLVGENAGTIERCSSAGLVEGLDVQNYDPYIGGLVGKNTGTIRESFSDVTVEMDPNAYYSGAGGLVGLNTSPGMIENSYAHGSVKAVYDGGGFVAWNQGGTIEHCYSTGSVMLSGGRTINDFPERKDQKYNRPERSLYIGGFTGFCTGTVTNCYWDEDTSGTTISWSGDGRSTVEMAEYPYDVLTYVDWDFESVWRTDLSGTINHGYPHLSANECRLLMMVRRSEEQPDHEDYRLAFETLQGQAGPPDFHGRDGWGVSYYTSDYFTTGETGRGKIWEPGQQALLNQDRYAHHEPANENDGETKYNTYIRDDFFSSIYQTDWHIIVGHIRKATTGLDSIGANPHPFIFTTGNGQGKRTYSFAHNGGISNRSSHPEDPPRQAMSDFISGLIGPPDWPSSVWGKYLIDVENQVDSKIFFGYLMAHIKLNDWDILRGLRSALTTVSLDYNSRGCTAWNFVLTDGYDTYAYRSFNSLHREIDHEGSTHTLEYKIIQKEGIEWVTVMSKLPNNDPYSFPNQLLNSELVYIPRFGEVQRFRNFSISQLSWQKEPSRADGLQNVSMPYTWDSFPVLNPFNQSDAAQTMNNATGFNYAFKVENSRENEYIHKPVDWQDYDLGDFISSEGYVMSHSTNDIGDYLGGLMTGEISDLTISKPLLEAGENWTGYWLVNDQSIQGALGGTQRQYIHSVRSSNWFWVNNQLSVTLNKRFPMEFGQMYKITLREGGEQMLDQFKWVNSRKPYNIHDVEEEEMPPPTEPSLLSFDPGFDYQVIEVHFHELHSPILEMGVKPMPGEYNPYIGGAVYDSNPFQIIINGEGFEGIDLELWYLDGNQEYVSPQIIELYDFKTELWEVVGPGDLVAGNGQYHIIRLTGFYEPPGEDPPTNLTGGASPNPFNPDVTLSFSIREIQDVEVNIYNIRGQKVKTVASGEYEPGNYSIVWQGNNDYNQTVGSGVYFYRITSGKETLTGKMLMLK